MSALMRCRSSATSNIIICATAFTQKQTRTRRSAPTWSIDLAHAIDSNARWARKTFEAQDETQQQAYGGIAKARFAIEGTNAYPDATFTLRLSYGTVRGYVDNGKAVPAFTDFGGFYQRATEHQSIPPSICRNVGVSEKIESNSTRGSTSFAMPISSAETAAVLLSIKPANSSELSLTAIFSPSCSMIFTMIRKHAPSQPIPPRL